MKHRNKNSFERKRRAGDIMWYENLSMNQEGEGILSSRSYKYGNQKYMSHVALRREEIIEYAIHF